MRCEDSKGGGGWEEEMEEVARVAVRKKRGKVVFLEIQDKIILVFRI